MKAPVVVLSANTSWYLYNYRKNTILALQSKGYCVVCLSPTDGYSTKLSGELGVKHIPLKMDNQGNNPIADFLLFFRFLYHYKRLRPIAAFQFTIKNNVYGTLAATILGIPAINNVSGLGSAFMRSDWISRIVKGLYRLSQPYAFRVFCQNVEDRSLLESERLVPAGKLHLLPGSGVDITRFCPVARESTPRPFRFLYLGRMLEDKGLRELIDAYRLLDSNDQVELWLSGFCGAKNKTAIDESQLIYWQEKYGINWLGVSDKPEEVLAKVDCIVLPSYREGLPRSILEASAMEIPAITTDAPGCREVVKHGHNGFLCTPRDVDSLAEAMRSMIAMPEADRKSMGKRGREMVEEKFDERIVIDQYLLALEAATQKGL